jgi:hypothetical protein
MSDCERVGMLMSMRTKFIKAGHFKDVEDDLQSIPHMGRSWQVQK